MIICSSCNNHEILGALFCSECGEQLDTSAGSSTDSFDALQEIEGEAPDVAEPAAVIPSRLTLYFAQYDSTIHFDEEKEYSVGRTSEGQIVLPDVDLSPMEGFENGISRIHASILIDENNVKVKDLGSSNGSMLNEQKLIPHLPFSLNDGDVLIFGKLVAQVMCKT